MRLGLVAVASPLEVGAGEAPALLSAATQALGATGLEVVAALATTPDEAVRAGRHFYDQRIVVLCVLAASWYEDYLVLDLLEECDVPVIAWARPGMETGSLCGQQQLVCVLRAIGKPAEFLFEPVDSPTAARRVQQYAAAAAMRAELRRARIGFLGQRVAGMTETTAPEFELKRVFGPRAVHLDTHQFHERVARVDRPLDAAWDVLTACVGDVTCARADGLDSLRSREVLRAQRDELGLSAIALGCYPDLMGRVCLAASLLGAEGTPLACEGDVNGALGMLILQRLSGEPVHNTDMLDPMPDDNAIVFSHCGSGAFSLAPSREAITLAPVRLMNRGVCCRFPARPGEVTLLNIVAGPGGYRLAALRGEALPTGMVFPGNPLKVRFDQDYRSILRWIVREGLGHHWMAAYGDWRVELRDFAGLVGIPLREPSSG